MNVRAPFYCMTLAALAVLTGCGVPESPKPAPTPATGTSDAVSTPAPTPKESVTTSPKVDPPKTDLKVGGDPAPAPGPKVDGKAVNVDTHTFTMPGNWKEVPPANSMRKYQASVTKSAGDPEDGEFSVLTGGGGVDANINRWTGQFGGPSSLVTKREIKTASGSTAIVVELEGAYSAMTMQGQQPPKADFAQLGAVVTTEQGDYFLKLIGPKKTVTDSKPAFDAMVGSFK